MAALETNCLSLTVSAPEKEMLPKEGVTFYFCYYFTLLWDIVDNTGQWKAKVSKSGPRSKLKSRLEKRQFIYLFIYFEFLFIYFNFYLPHEVIYCLVLNFALLHIQVEAKLV